MDKWTIDQARLTYNVRHWSAGYFDVNEQGHVCVHASANSNSCVDLYELIGEVSKTLTLPFLLRFSNILHDRVHSICSAFTTAMQQDDYQGNYTVVYPIKVNQQCSVIEHILKDNQGCVGLEAGSKPELMAVMALHNHNNGVIVCNGYKDREYIRLALIGQQLGLKVYIVIEKTSELKLILEESEKLKLVPLLGVRVRLASIGAGKWQNTGGEKAKFGLNATQLLECIKQLREAGQLACLQMIHFHLGSQLPNIGDIQRGMRECARYYAELHRLGVNINCVDVGGGLGVDYEGTRSRSFCSTNYTTEEYAHSVVHALWEVCQQNDLPHPNILSESGRALTAHHAVLVTNVIETSQVADHVVPEPPADNVPVILQDMWQHYQDLEQSLSNSALREVYHDVHHGLDEVQSMYVHGALDLSQRALAEDIYFASCRLLRSKLDPAAKQYREILDELNDKLADKYFCNFSIFQSAPDVWAIDQIFPIMPLHRLDEQPTRRGVIEDITCDSDGRIDHYVDNEGIESSLPLHKVNQNEAYLLGIFLVGAYQEILGDMHNLFGDTDSIDVYINEDNSYQLSKGIRGDTVDSVLRYVHIDAVDLLERYKEKLKGNIDDEQLRQTILEEIQNGLHGYTYLEDE